MSHFEGFKTIRLVKVGPSLRERLERRIAAAHHKAVIARLRRFREGLERDMAPEDWTTLEGPMVVLLSDVCNALGLLDKELGEVLGQDGERMLADILEARPVPFSWTMAGEPQTGALACVRGRARNG